jgi:hypothetical protein
MAGLSITGQMKVSTLQEGFLKEFGLTLRVYDGREFADPSQTLAQVRKKKGSGKALSVAKNMKVGNLEDKFEEEFGLKVQVAGSDDSYLCKDELTLNAAQQEDEKKLARKERKAARQAEASDDGDDDRNEEDKTIEQLEAEVLADMMGEQVKDEDTIQYLIDYSNPKYASTIQWLSEDYKISDLVPYISAIICEGEEEFEELWGDDFKVISLDGFDPKEGDDENTFILCYTSIIELNVNKFPKFKDALDFSSDQVEIKIGFKLPNGDDVDQEVCEGHSDIPVRWKASASPEDREAIDDSDGDEASKSGSDEEAKTYFINYNKSRDACSIIWESEDHLIGDLEPYIFTIQCDDGEDFHELINADWPDADGKDDFKTLELNNFEAVEGDSDNEYLLCFTALVAINFGKHPKFKKALEKADNQIVARIQFKKDGKPILDNDGYEEFLYEMHQDNFVDLELDS